MGPEWVESVRRLLLAALGLASSMTGTPSGPLSQSGPSAPAPSNALAAAPHVPFPRGYLSVPVQSGTAKHYRSGLMQRVYERRVAQGLMPVVQKWQIDGFASTPDQRKLGELVWVSFFDPAVQGWGPTEVLLVVDCSAPADRARHIRQGLVIETDYDTARRNHWEWDYERESGEGETRARIFGFGPVPAHMKIDSSRVEK